MRIEPDERRWAWWQVALWILAALIIAKAAMAGGMPPADYRFASGECRTWGSGKYRSATVWARVYEQYAPGWDYPVKTEYRFVCQYAGDPDPVSSKPGEYVWKIASNCFAKTVLIDGEMRTSFPTLTTGYSVEYTEGWAYGQVWCKYDEWYYGAEPAPTTTTMPSPGPIP